MFKTKLLLLLIYVFLFLLFVGCDIFKSKNSNEMSEEDFINWYVQYTLLYEKYKDNPVKFKEEYDKIFSSPKYSFSSFKSFQNRLENNKEKWVEIMNKIDKRLKAKQNKEK